MDTDIFDDIIKQHFSHDTVYKSDMLAACEAAYKLALTTDSDEGTEVPLDRVVMCEWAKAFDGNFNISCVGETGQRGNGGFKGKNARWDFKYCPYCGREIKEIST